MNEENIIFDQSSEGIYNCIIHLLTMYPDNKVYLLTDTLSRLNKVVFSDNQETFEFYKSFLIDILNRENNELSQSDSQENKLTILNNYKTIKELEKIEK